MLIPFEEAIHTVLSGIQSLGSERITLADGLGRVLARPVIARRAVPPADNSAMDGYALKHADQGAALPVPMFIAAGSWPERTLGSGEAARIFTGAPVPEGADTVVAQERTERDGDGPVRIVKPETLGANIRRAGEDVMPGDSIGQVGQSLTPGLIGLLAGQGLTWVDVVRRPVVAILSTGDEVHEPGDPLPRGHIVSSNSWALAARVQEAGGIPRYLGIARDDRASLDAALDGITGADVLLTIGGVSVGELDFVKEAIAARGGEQRFWKVKVRPGKPNAFGRIGDVRWFGLPGNPVSCDVSFLMYVRPALRAMQGHAHHFLPTREARLEHDLRKRVGFLILFRGVHHPDDAGDLMVRTTGPQGSGIQSSMAKATCLIVAPEESEMLRQGSRVRIVMLPGEVGQAALGVRRP
ncbi:MAG: molybdopterin molybdotransferase MoeA [Deltaproteobacteria bacterium]|nr:molybdopterin molybdotransferase MoeA [Deltaproteobacteria bacterium]